MRNEMALKQAEFRKKLEFMNNERESLLNEMDQMKSSLSEKEILLLLITSIAIIIRDSESNKLLDKVKEKGLVDALNGVGEFLINTKKLINNISSKVIGVTYSLLDILGFALLLNPTMNIVNNIISDENITSSDTNRLLSGAAFATVVYGLKSVMSKIKNKITPIENQLGSL
jgi:hypothetical protein